MPCVTLDRKTLAPGCRPYVIAEIGVNHEGSFETAIRLIDAAKEAGADAAKFQTYKAEKLAMSNSPAYWDLTSEPTTSQRALFKKYDAFEVHQYEALARHCVKVGIEFLSTPFDEEAVDFLDPIMGYFKIASADITNVPLLRRVGAKRKPVVLSTGASALWEIAHAVDILKSAGSGDIVLMQCILNYPCDYSNANLNMITGLAQTFPDHVIGYSDHTRPDPGMYVLTTAWLKGALVLEKHFTLDKTLPGNDHYHAMDPADLTAFRRNVAFLMPALGSVHKTFLESENGSRKQARRSVVPTRPLKAGEILSADVLTCKRPASGISPVHWDEIIGRRVRRDVPEDVALTWADLDE